MRRARPTQTARPARRRHRRPRPRPETEPQPPPEPRGHAHQRHGRRGRGRRRKSIEVDQGRHRAHRRQLRRAGRDPPARLRHREGGGARASRPASGSRPTSRAPSRSRATWRRTPARSRSLARLRRRTVVITCSPTRADWSAARTCRSPSGCSAGRRRWCWSSRSSRWRSCGRSRKLERDGWRPLPGGLGRVLAQPAGRDRLRGDRRVPAGRGRLQPGCAGTQSPAANFAPTFVYVIFWLGLVPASVLFGDVFRAFNPWRAIGRAVGLGGRHAWRAAGCRRRWPTPSGSGTGPRPPGIFAFAVLELVRSNGDQPETVAIATLVYSALTFVAMALYGVEAWSERGEAFSVYFNLFSRISPCRDARPAWSGCARRCPASPRSRPAPGTVALLAVMIGSVTFDGAVARRRSGPASRRTSPASSATSGCRRSTRLRAGLPRRADARRSCSSTASTGSAMLGAQSVGGGFSAEQLARAFVHSLVPIALAYVAAHYLTCCCSRARRSSSWPPTRSATAPTCSAPPTRRSTTA